MIPLNGKTAAPRTTRTVNNLMDFLLIVSPFVNRWIHALTRILNLWFSEIWHSSPLHATILARRRNIYVQLVLLSLATLCAMSVSAQEAKVDEHAAGLKI